jgi:sugar phosphate permease
MTSASLEKYHTFTHLEVTQINFLFLIFYAPGNIISGHFADRINVRRFLVISYALISVLTLLLGSLMFLGIKNWYIFTAVEIGEGLIQSMGFPTNLAIICNWFPKKGRGIIVGIWASCQNVGDIVGTQMYKIVV